MNDLVKKFKIEPDWSYVLVKGSYLFVYHSCSTHPVLEYDLEKKYKFILQACPLCAEPSPGSLENVIGVYRAKLRLDS